MIRYHLFIRTGDGDFYSVSTDSPDKMEIFWRRYGGLSKKPTLKVVRNGVTTYIVKNGVMQ